VNVHHRRAVTVFGLVLGLDVALGIAMAVTERVPAWHGVYCTVGLTTTDGCDLAFHGWQAYVIAAAAMVLLVPLWAGVFSLFAAGFVADHVDRRHHEQQAAHPAAEEILTAIDSLRSQLSLVLRADGLPQAAAGGGGGGEYARPARRTPKPPERRKQ
jgi:hypothetical protein